MIRIPRRRPTVVERIRPYGIHGVLPAPRVPPLTRLWARLWYVPPGARR